MQSILWDQPDYPSLERKATAHSKKLGIKRSIKNPHQSTPQKLGKCPKKALNLLCRVHTAGHCNQSCPPDTQRQEIKTIHNQIFPLHNLPFLYGCVISQTLLPLNDRFWPKASAEGTQNLMHFHTKVIRYIASQASAVTLTASSQKYC